MRRSTVFYIHIGYWIYTFVFLEMALQLAYGKSIHHVLDFFRPLALSNYLIFPVIFYINYLLVMPGLLKRNKYLLSALAWVGLCFLYVLLRYYIQEVFFKKYLGICNYCNFNNYNYITVNFFQSLSWILLPGIVIWLLDHRFKVERRNIELQQEKLKNERAYLQAQLNPHFVFNSLHTIYSMVFHNAQESLSAIKTFSDILRYSLNPSKAEVVQLTAELDHLKKYIELQKYRTHNACVNMEVKGIFEGSTVPPLLLITFVENAFKHGIYNDPLNPINISIEMADNTLLFGIMNKVNPNRQLNSLAIGLSGMKRILELEYANNHILTIEEKNNIYAVSLTIKLIK